MIGVVGDGFGALLVYTTAVYLGFRPEQIGIFGGRRTPSHTYQQFAWNLGQTVLRSESESHFLPADWPTFAQMDACARLDPVAAVPLGRRKFNPGVPEILAEARIVATHARLREPGARRAQGRLGRPRAGAAAALLALRRGARPARARKHVMIAIGHGPLSFPGVYGKARENPRRPTGSCRPTSRRSTTRAAATSCSAPGSPPVNEWVNGVDAGAQCIALRRNPQPDEQDLNVPRCLFDGSGIDAFQGLSLRPARRLPRAACCAGPPRAARLGRQGGKEARGGPLRGGDRQRDRDPARARPACASTCAYHDGGDAGDRRDRHRLRHRVRQVAPCRSRCCAGSSRPTTSR